MPEGIVPATIPRLGADGLARHTPTHVGRCAGQSRLSQLSGVYGCGQRGTDIEIGQIMGHTYLGSWAPHLQRLRGAYFKTCETAPKWDRWFPARSPGGAREASMGVTPDPALSGVGAAGAGGV